jgi:hypothetical protein
MTWQSSLPLVDTIAECPALVTDRKVVRRLRGADRVDGDAHVAVGAVLEADRARQAGGQFAMHLRLGGARADRAPGDQVGGVLRRDRVEELGRAGQAHLVDLEQQPRARRTPSLMRKLLSRRGSLISPFQPTVVRGFSK